MELKLVQTAADTKVKGNAKEGIYNDGYRPVLVLNSTNSSAKNIQQTLFQMLFDIKKKIEKVE